MIKRNNVISQARGLFPSKTPAASPIINFLSLSKGQQPRISNPKLKASDTDMHMRKSWILSRIATVTLFTFDPINSQYKLRFEISMELFQLHTGFTNITHGTIPYTLYYIILWKHNHRKRLISIYSMIYFIQIYFIIQIYITIDFLRFNSHNLWWSIPIETLTNVYFCFTETNEASLSRDYQR